MPEMVIHTEKLSKHFKGVQALTDLSMDVPAHSIVGFLGPNGAGKSTTIKLLLGLIHPSSGRASIFGQDITRHSLEIRQRVGYLAQQPKFDEAMTARQTLRFVAKFFYSGPKQLIEARVEESLKLVGLDDKADRVVRGFSGGEMQRLGIAQAQINEPDLLILDEPAAALDPMGRRDVLNIMERLRERSTIFYSTHILDDVQRVSDRVVILNKGSLVAQGPIESLLQSEEGAIYHVALNGDVETAQARVKALSWVNNLFVRNSNGVTHWQVGVTDTAAAEQLLLRTIMADDDIQVLEYGPETYELEDVFMKVVQ
ncbi:MAG: multidrug ABC transporter ATP-binding protein [Anaerolineaceae bacterium]|nr:multidrug ABC transporter ATP-binding protein [Anaerolineaceae bacterium]